MRKRSIKLLIMLAGVLVAMLVTGLLILRTDIKAVIAELEKGSKFREIEVAKFTSVDFSDNWSVRISPGIHQKVEIEIDEDLFHSQLQVIQGVLYFDQEYMDSIDQPRIKARITTPFLYSIKASTRTDIDVERFDLDSLFVVIEDKGSFKARENSFKYVSLKTSGEVDIEWIDDPFK